MTNRPEIAEADVAPSTSLPFWTRNMRLTKEQLAAAQRTREYHVQKLQSRMLQTEPLLETAPRQEH